MNDMYIIDPYKESKELSATAKGTEIQTDVRCYFYNLLPLPGIVVYLEY